MNAQLFSDAMSELNERYVMEAATYQRKIKSQTQIWLSRVACFFLVFLLTGSAILTFSVEARAAFFGWVREQYEVFYEYFFEGEAAVTDPEKYELGWVPEGCIFVTSYETAGGETYIFTDEYDTLISFSYTSKPDNETLYVDGVGYAEKQVTIDGNPGTFYISHDEAHTDGIVWTDTATNTLFSISGHFDEDTLIRIAENVRVKPLRYELGYMPENCVFVTSYEIPGGKSFVYTDEKDSLICFTYQVGADGGSFFVDSVKAEKINVTINGCPGEISLYKDSEETDHIIWTDSTNKVLFYITGHFDQETFIKMAESVTEVIN